MTKVQDTVAACAAAVSGEGTPEAVKVVQKEDRLARMARALSGPAISGMLIANISILTWGSHFGAWTEASEETRAGYVGMIGVALAGMLGVALWVTIAGRPSRMEVSAGPASFKIEGASDHNTGGVE